MRLIHAFVALCGLMPWAVVGGEAASAPLPRDAGALPPGAVARIGTPLEATLPAYIQNLSYTKEGLLHVRTLEALVVLDGTTGVYRKEFRPNLKALGLGFGYPVLSPDGRLWAHSDESNIGTLGAWIVRDAAGKVRLKTPGISLSANQPSISGSFHAEFSRDGLTFFTCWNDEVTAWDATKRARKFRFKMPGFQEGSNLALELSPDGRFVAVGDTRARGRWVILDARGASVGTVESGQRIVFSPDGALLAVLPPPDHSAKAATIRILEAPGAEQKCELTLDLPAIQALAFSQDGTLLAASGRAEIEVWEVPAARRRHRLPGAAVAIAFSPDGKSLATAASGERAIRTWDLATGKELRERTGHRGPLTAVRFQPQARRIATAASDGTVRLWNPDAPTRPLETWVGQAPLAFSADGARLAACGISENTFWLRDVKGGPPRTYEDGSAEVHAGAEKNWLWFEGPSVACLSSTGVFRRFDPAGREQATSKPDAQVHLSNAWPTGSSFFAALQEGQDYLLAKYNGATGKEEARLSMPRDEQGYPFYAAGPEQGSWCLQVAPTYGVFRALSTGKELGRCTWPDLGYPYGPPAFSCDARYLLLPRAKGPAVLWETASNAAILELPVEGATCAAFGSDPRSLATGHADGTVLYWDLSRLAGETPTSASPNESDYDALWDELAHADASRAFKALWRLARGGASAATFLRKRLAASSEPAGRAEFDKAVRDLSREAFQERQRGSDILRRNALLMEDPLRKLLAAAGSNKDLQNRLSDILDELDGPILSDAQARRIWRSVLVLEATGAAEAVAALDDLARRAPQTRLGRAAAASSGRLKVARAQK